MEVGERRELGDGFYLKFNGIDFSIVVEEKDMSKIEVFISLCVAAALQETLTEVLAGD